MSAIDPGSIDVTQPPAVNPTTSGLRSVISSIKAQFTTAKAEVEGLDTRVTALEEGGGGAGVYQDFALGELATEGEVELDHAEVPVDSLAWKVEAQATLPGPSRTRYLPGEPYGEQGWDIPSVSWFEQGITWTNDGYVNGNWTGHFSKPYAEPLRRGCHLKVVDQGVMAAICRFDGPGTNPSDVVVNVELPSGTLEWARALNQSEYNGLFMRYAYFDGGYIYPNMNDYLAYMRPELAFDVPGANISVWRSAPTANTYFPDPGINWAMLFFSKDGGQTWWGWKHDTGEWISGVNPESADDRYDYGIRINPSSYSPVLVETPTASWREMTTEEWAAWAQDAAGVTVVVWLSTTDYRYGTTLYDIYLEYNEANYTALLNVGAPGGDYGGNMVQLEARRLSPTRTRLTNRSGHNLVDLRVRVFTG